MTFLGHWEALVEISGHSVQWEHSLPWEMEEAGFEEELP